MTPWRQDETYVESHVRLAYRYQHAAEHDQSVVHFRRAIELNPQAWTAVPDLGQLPVAA